MTVFVTVWPWPSIFWPLHAERLQWSICVPSLVLIAQAVFLSESGQTDRQTDRRDWTPYHAGGYAAGVGNKNILADFFRLNRHMKCLQSATRGPSIALGIKGTAVAKNCKIYWCVKQMLQSAVSLHVSAKTTIITVAGSKLNIGLSVDQHAGDWHVNCWRCCLYAYCFVAAIIIIIIIAFPSRRKFVTSEVLSSDAVMWSQRLAAFTTTVHCDIQVSRRIFFIVD